MTDLTREEEGLYRRVAEIIEAARSHVARSVNTAMVHAYWHVGREMIEVEQQGKARAEHGERLIANLAKRLSERFGRGWASLPCGGFGGSTSPTQPAPQCPAMSVALRFDQHR